MKPIVLLCLLFFMMYHVAHSQSNGACLVKEGFIFSNPPFAACHAPTIAETANGKIMAAWFAGPHEGHPDVSIWTAVFENNSWSKPVNVADGVQSDTLRYPCWNPVLFKTGDQKLHLFYKVGPNPRQWWGLMKTSEDGGATWSEAKALPNGMLGPIKNKPLQLKDGTVLHPSSTESLDEKRWTIHVERSNADFTAWQKINIDCDSFGVIQPTILQHGNGLQLLSRSRQNKVVQTVSGDGGLTWSKLEAIPLPNPNSGIDGVSLAGGGHLLVYNPMLAGKDWWEGRSHLSVAISKNGVDWKAIYQLETEDKGEFSYPAIIQASDGLVHIVYTYNRKAIKHVVLKVADE